jgi:protease IV
MKSFFKYLLASILGVMLAFGMLFIIFIGIISIAISSQNKPVEINSNTILLLNLNKSINDRKSSLPVLVYNLTSFGAERQTGLNDLLNNIERAAKDEKIRGIYLELSDIQAGIATLEEIRNALIDFKKSGKFIIAYSDSYAQGAYYVASCADKIYLNPAGSVDFVGLSAEVMFYKKILDKLDIKPEVIRHGKFKSAVEPYMYDKMSAENRDQIKTYMGSIWNHITGQISISRNIPAEKLNTFADDLLLWNTDSAVSYKIVDALLYKDQVLDSLAKLVEISNTETLGFVTHEKYLKVPKPRDNKGYVREKIAVIYALGDIVSGDQGENVIGSEKMAKTIRDARRDSTIKAIVFRVNSPGGDALASEVIWRELYLARQVKPVIASMGDVAASGGFYILAAADTVVANPNTITGSIGVFGLLVNAGDFLENKLGITTDIENTNAHSDMGSIYRPLSVPERAALQNMVDVTYSTFVKRVSDGRNMPYNDVDKIGEGRVWSGNNAKELGLVDVIGGLNTAIEIAAKKAGLENYRIVELPKIDEPFTQIMKTLADDITEKVLNRDIATLYNQYNVTKNLLKGNRIQARMPFEIIVH